MSYVYKEFSRPHPWWQYRTGARFKVLLPFYFFEWCAEWAAYTLSRMAWLDVLEICGSLSLLVGLLFYFAGTGSRLEQKHYQAWQVINTAQGKGGSGGRLDALQDLNDDGVPLTGVDVTDAFLQGINLPRCKLQRARLASADMRGAVLDDSDLSDTDLVYTNLQHASLRNVNIASADLSAVDLSYADLTGVRNWQTVSLDTPVVVDSFTGKKAIVAPDLTGIRHAPDGFIEMVTQEVAAAQARFAAAQAAAATTQK